MDGCEFYTLCGLPLDDKTDVCVQIDAIDHFELEQQVAGRHRCAGGVANMFDGDLHEEQCILYIEHRAGVLERLGAPQKLLPPLECYSCEALLHKVIPPETEGHYH